MKKTCVYILIFIQVIFTGNFGVVYAAIGDIGHWRDSIGGQIPGTTFGGFDFDSKIRNDGIYSKTDNSTLRVHEAGDYLIIATTKDQDSSNGRYNSQLRVAQTAGTGDVFSSYYTGYSRDASENQSWTRALGIIIGASANSEFQVQKRRDTDAPTGGSVVNASDIQVIKIDQTNYGIYNIGGTGNSYGGVTPNTVDISSVVHESDTNAIQGNIASDTISLKNDHKTYLLAWSVSMEGASGIRTQRIGQLSYDGGASLSTRSYCYMRDASNQYCGLGSMDIIQTQVSNRSVGVQVYRGDGVAADQGGADQDGSISTDGNGQLIILEMPDSLEVFRGEDSVGLQDVSTPQILNIAETVSINKGNSFVKNSNSQISVSQPADIFSWANIWTARGNPAASQRLTSYGFFQINGVNQTTGQHGNYSRGNQGTRDTFALSYHPAGIFTTSSAGTTIQVNSSPLPGTEGGGNDRTQPGTLGFFALNLDTLTDTEAPSIQTLSFGSGTLLPGGNHSLEISYEDNGAGVDTSSVAFELQKWDAGAASWGADIASSIVSGGSITDTLASYNLTGMQYGKYRYNFSISDRMGNTTNFYISFYVDEPEFIISHPERDIGDLEYGTFGYSDDLIITVRTIGAPFSVSASQNGPLQKDAQSQIPNWDGTSGFGYEQTPYSGSLSQIGNSVTLASETQNIQSSGDYQEYTYTIRLGALNEQMDLSAGHYETLLDFHINLDYDTLPVGGCSFSGGGTALPCSL